MTRVLVVGFGSIGQRHARLLVELGCIVSVVTRRPTCEFASYRNISDALNAEPPNYIVIATETARHIENLTTLEAIGYRGRILVEKPLSGEPHMPSDGLFAQLVVAYNLRFHPIMTALRARLKGLEALAVSARAGQHLSEWRSGRNYRETYSASRSTGGGVLRDLSHELDYMLWLFGDWRRVAALGGPLGALEIEADEHWAILMECDRAPIAELRLSYLDRPARREIVVTTREATITADLIAGTLGVDGVVERFETDRDVSYRNMHRAMIEEDAATLCSVAEGAAVVRLIAAIEKSAKSRRWIDA